MKNINDFTDSQIQDLLYLLQNKYAGDAETLSLTWDLDEGAIDEWKDLFPTSEARIPDIEELKADAYRQLKASLAKASDPQKIANSLKILEDMKDRDASRGDEEKMKTVSQSVEALVDDLPVEVVDRPVTDPVVSEHVKKPARKKKPKPSKDINGLDENSDNP